ncbi:DUF881 domain-containing protein [Aquibacillus rhizosphaerae]|uniref:DUF881 domain-containing protein n=1 Tax=Aquibacillus rhizosphaerae TaxID=3051431 RepID=A0ABT7L5X2_9BACI|nr:DUF881 domain-containing protein [Aquibacillus sp. LR5S19]MDL4841261.1 DUF881 domain-containing protein [Aquibacillus sp. LR5S19]
MQLRNKIIISLVCAFTGLMIAIQFQSTQEPTERDTRDLWEIRSQLQVEQKKQQQLYQQIAEMESIKDQYEAMSEQEQIDTLVDSIEELEQKAGLTDISGKGILIHINPIYVEMDTEQEYPEISPELLNRLINELNNYGATEIAIENERVINITPIRYVNGKTYVNNRALPSLPLQIKVLAANPERLLDHIEVSQSRDYFAIENLDLTAEVSDELLLPKYEGNINLDNLEVNESQETGEE